MRKISPVVTAPIAVATILIGTTWLVSPKAHANHEHWVKAHQGSDVAKVLAASGDVKVRDRECDGHHVIVQIAYLDSHGDQVISRRKDDNGCEAGGPSFNVGAYAPTTFRVGEYSGDHDLFGNKIYYWGHSVTIDYDD